MESQNKPTAKDFFLNLGAIIALGVFVGNLISLLFTVINKAYPITTGYNYYSSYSISFPVATLIIVFPLYILFMWLLERDYSVYPEQKRGFVRRWLTFITLFVSGGTLIGDLVTVLYYFIDGQEMTAGFIMKILSILVISLAIFFYYTYDLLGKSNNTSRKIWVGASVLVILLSIVWGFSVLGSPRTQRLLKYDEQKVNDLASISNKINTYYSQKGDLPVVLADTGLDYYVPEVDSQSQKPYEYTKTGNTTYNICAEFNKASTEGNQRYKYPSYLSTWQHPAGRYCFNKTINPNLYSEPIPVY
ncbi:MAG: DUF5671 domain-containing protein [Candidatus Paceibacterota bacterium]|jgi:hypothetical protein